MNRSEAQETEGGSFLGDYVLGKAIDLALKGLKAAWEVYTEFSAETGGEYVIHHAQ